MRIAATLAVAWATVISSHLHAGESYDSYDTFYAAQPGALFGPPIQQDSGVVYSWPGERGIHTDIRATVDGRRVRIELAENRITVNGKTWRFARAKSLAGEHAADIYPASADVFLAEKTDERPSALCVEGGGSGSGEADRYQQIFLLVNPLARQPTFLHLPGLLSSCRAVVATKDGKLAFPKNRYLFDEAQESRVGLLVSYYTFEHSRFVRTAALKQRRLRFSRAEMPFEFSVEDND